MKSALLAVLYLGCAVAVPSEPDMPLYQTPNPEWIAGYHEAERCTGRQGDVTRIRWHVVPGDSFRVDGEQLIGLTIGHDIYLAENWAGHRWLARHEAIHALGIHDHPSTVYNTACHAIWGDIREIL